MVLIFSVTDGSVKVERKVFFGGSFDPPHRGHLGIARGALKSGKCDRVIWFPGFVPPHKQNASRANFSDRMAMVKLLIAGEKNMEVSDFENILQLFPSYTIEVLSRLEKAGYGKFSLLIGADSLLNLHTWHRAEELVAKYDFIVYPRPRCEVSKAFLKQFWSDAVVEKLLNSVVEGTFFEISSSEIKKSMEKNCSRNNIIDETMLTPEVAEYIREHNLYNR